MIVSLFSTWVICQSTTIWCCGLCRKRTLSTRVYWQTNVWTTWCMYYKMVSGNWDPEQCTAKWTNSFRSWRLEQKHSLKYVGVFLDLIFLLFFSSGNLHFLKVNRSSGNKKFACGIWNERMTKLVKGYSMALNISNPIDSTAALLPRSIYHCRSKALLGKSAILQCLFSGMYENSKSWLAIMIYEF